MLRRIRRFQRMHQKLFYGSQCRASFRLGEIRVLDSKGQIDRVIPFNDTNREV